MGFMDKLKGAAKVVTEKASAVVDQLKEGQEISNKIKAMDYTKHVYGDSLATGDNIKNYIGFKFVTDGNNVKILDNLLVYQATVTKTEMATIEKYSIVKEFTRNDIVAMQMKPLEEKDYANSDNTRAGWRKLIYWGDITIILKDGTSYRFLFGFDLCCDYDKEHAVYQMEDERKDVKKYYDLIIELLLFIQANDKDSQNAVNHLFDMFFDQEGIDESLVVSPEERLSFKDGKLDIDAFFSLLSKSTKILFAKQKAFLQELDN